MLELGLKPEPLRVIFTRGKDFHQVVTLEGTDFDGVPPVLVFGALGFKAVLTNQGQVADFLILATDITTLAAADDRTVVLEHLGNTIARGRYEVI